MSIAVKFEGDADCHIFTNESYLFKKWQRPEWRLGPGCYRVQITIFYDGGRKLADFELRNDGPGRDDLRLVPWPKKTRRIE
jgi:hypothetical protein